MPDGDRINIGRNNNIASNPGAETLLRRDPNSTRTEPVFTGRNPVDDGDGINGVATNASGVRGSSNSLYGGLFQGGKAPLKLQPSHTGGRPTTGQHTKGELFMDSGGALFVCTADGTPGTWRRFTTTSA